MASGGHSSIDDYSNVYAPQIQFRVPLRPSFSPVRLLFMAQLSAPLNAFISLSNIRLVNSEGAEIGCQSLEDRSTASSPALFSIDSIKGAKEPQGDHRALLAELGLDWLAKQPAPLQLPTSALGGAGLPFPSPPPFPATDSMGRNGGEKKNSIKFLVFFNFIFN